MGLKPYFDESYVPPSTGVAAQVERLEAEVLDLEQCLAGKSISKKWQQIQVLLISKKGELAAKKRSLRIRGPKTSVTGEARP